MPPTSAPPSNRLAQIPPGDYSVQAFVNVYSEFRRSDGHVVWMHDDQWEGQRWNRSPGNFYSLPRQITLDPAKGYRIPLVCDQVIPPVQIPPDTEWVKRFKIQSQILTKFWGRPIYLGATVLLPRDYARSTLQYPVLYEQGHFGLGAPLGFSTGQQPGRGGRGGSPELYNEWIKDNFPRMIVVTLQHPNPYFDDSYAVNSVNVGPYGDAIHQELIPEIEKRFRVIRQPWARLLSGGSTGRLGSPGPPSLPPRFLRRHVVILPRFGGLLRRRRHQHLRGHQRLLQADRLAPRAHYQQPRDQRPGPLRPRSSATISSS